MEKKTIDLCEVRFAEGDASSMTFEGYGAVFKNVDSYGDVIAPGAFADTLAAWNAKGKMPAMLLQHGGFMGNAADMTPIGKWTKMAEDGKGLVVEGKLAATQRGKDVYELLKIGAIDGLSIGFRPVEFRLRSKPDEPRRTLTKVHLMETSVVTFPANDQALVSAVKSAETIREFEDFLRDVGGFSLAQAKAIASNGFKAGADLRDADAPDEELSETLTGLLSLIKAQA